jgi:nitroimidazol reductase NimA-like FMN-containing flavoprotein (pyridoxamine 5'-phosphate oxidase superfamily)
MQSPNEETIRRLESAGNIWVACVRPDGRPHLTPVWFAYVLGKLYISIGPGSVKSRSMAHNPQVVLALEDGLSPVICEGRAAPLEKPWPAPVLETFFQKYEWDLLKETQYNQLLEITPAKWLVWSAGQG